MSQFNLHLKSYQELPKGTFDTDQYILSPELEGAIKVAIALNQPLLLTGEPGTGKTKLAFKIAAELHKQDASFFDKPLIFNTKTTSSAQDLFYTYDAIRHFHQANLSKNDSQQAPETAQYIELQALGKAIALTNENEVKNGLFSHKLGGSLRSSVVLIDEIDKAPRDFTNDVLNEIENYEFEIKELNNQNRIKKGTQQRIIVLMTSNSEKNLPDAFLRRCVFYHIPFPSADQLQQIVQAQFGKATAYTQSSLIEHFMQIRKAATRKAPATAELIAWLKILEIEGFFKENTDFEQLTEKQKNILRFSYSVLVKTKEDLVAVEKILKSV